MKPTPKPIREMTFFIECSYRRVRVAMPDQHTVSYQQSEGIGGEFKELSMGSFNDPVDALAYYTAKVDKLRASGWRTLSFE